MEDPEHGAVVTPGEPWLWGQCGGCCWGQGPLDAPLSSREICIRIGKALQEGTYGACWAVSLCGC